MAMKPMQIINGTEDGWIGEADDYVVVATSAADITLPSTGYSLVRVQPVAGATPADFRILFDGISTAMFPAGSNATNGVATWAVNYRCGLVFPGAIQTFGGATALPQVTLYFSKARTNAPGPEAYRAIAFTNATQHTTKTALTAATYPAGESIPRGVIALSTVSGNQMYWPTVGSGIAQAMADFVSQAATWQAAPRLPKSATLTISVLTPTTQGASAFYVYYTPV